MSAQSQQRDQRVAQTVTGYTVLIQGHGKTKGSNFNIAPRLATLCTSTRPTVFRSRSAAIQRTDSFSTQPSLDSPPSLPNHCQVVF